MPPPIRLVGPSGETIDPALVDVEGASVGDTLKVLTGPVAGWATAASSDEQAQDAVGAMIANTPTVNLTYTDATPELKADVLATFQTLTDGATVTWTVTDKPYDIATVTLGGNRTLAIAGAAAGYCGILIVKQDGTGSRTLTLPSGSKVRDAGAGAVVLSTATNAVDVLGWVYDGTSYWWAYNRNFT